MALNPQNLKVPTSEQARINGRKGGKARAKKQRERKAMQEIAKIVLDMPMGKGALDDLEAMDFSQLREKKLTVAEKSILMAAKKAIRGDLSAIAFLRDTAGERPVERVEVSTDVSKAESEIRAMLDEMGDE